MSKPVRVSYSAIVRYKECAEKYYLSRKYKSTIIGSALSFGKAIDSALGLMLDKKDEEGIFEEALESFYFHWHTQQPDKYEPEPKQIYDSLHISYYKSDFEKRLLSDFHSELDGWCEELGLESNEWDVEYKKCQATIDSGKQMEEKYARLHARINWLCLKEKGRLMLEAFYDDVLPKITNVISVQESIDMVNEEGDGKIGYIDLIAEHEDFDKPIIFDIKTAARPYDNHKLDTSEQLVGYLAGKPELDTNLIGYIVLLKAVKFDTVCNKCGAPKDGRKINCTTCKEGKYSVHDAYCTIQVMVTEVDNEEIDNLMDEDSNVITAIKNDIRYKNRDSCFKYNRKCDFYDICWGNKDVEEIPFLEEKK